MVLPDPPAAPQPDFGVYTGLRGCCGFVPTKKGAGISALTALHLPLGPGRGCGASGGVQDSQIPMALLRASFVILGGWEGTRGAHPAAGTPGRWIWEDCGFGTAVDLGQLWVSMAVFWGRGSSAPGTLRPHLTPEGSCPHGEQDFGRMQPQSTCSVTGGEPGEREVLLPLDYRRL